MNDNLSFPSERLLGIEAYKGNGQKALSTSNGEDVLKLDWNESPLPPSPFAIKAILETVVQENALNWYPDIESSKLRELLADHLEVDFRNIQTFCGSDGALEIIIRSFVVPDDKLLIVSPTYDNFRIYGLSTGCEVEMEKPKDIFDLKIGDLIDLVKSANAKAVYLCNPNNPTGWLVKNEDLSVLADMFPETLFIIDEAYADFAGFTFAKEATKRRNTIITRTFSKVFGLAGLRIGYIVASIPNVETINKIRIGKNVNVLAQSAALAALKDTDHLAKTLKRVENGKQILIEGLDKIGLQYRVTPANFILIQHPDVDLIRSQLQLRNIYVRSLTHLIGLKQFLRITIGSPDQMERVVDALRDIIAG